MPLIPNIFDESSPHFRISLDPAANRPVPHRHVLPSGLEMATSSQWKSNPRRTTCFPTWVPWSSSSRGTSQAACKGRGTTTCCSSRSPPPPWPGSSGCSSPTRTACSSRSTRSRRPRWTRQGREGATCRAGPGKGWAGIHTRARQDMPKCQHSSPSVH